MLTKKSVLDDSTSMNETNIPINELQGVLNFGDYRSLGGRMTDFVLKVARA